MPDSVSGQDDDMTLFGDEHVRRYQETDGAEGYYWRKDTTILLLTTTGRDSTSRQVVDQHHLIGRGGLEHVGQPARVLGGLLGGPAARPVGARCAANRVAHSVSSGSPSGAVAT